MNKRLQAILDLLQQSGSLTPEEKKSLADAVKESDKEITITEFKLERTEKVKRTTAILLEETIAELEQKRKSVEAQNRELEIEAALERVRSSAMAMHNSNDISATTSIVFTELQKLGTQSIRCGVGLLSNDSHMAQVYAATTSSDGEFHTLMRTISMTEHSSLAQQYETWLKQENYQTVLKGEDLKSYYNLPFFHSSASYAPPEHYDQKEYGYYFPFPEGLFYAWTEIPYSESELNILNRFKTIIALTFRRYLDLKKAEAQARESQVQLALERVRARTMAMQRSEELTDTAALLFQQIEELGIHQWGNSFQLWDDDMRAVTAWTCTQGLEVQKFKIPTTEDPVMINIVNAAQKGEILHVEEMGGEALEDHYKFMYSLPVFKKILDNLAATGITPPKFQVMYAAYFSSGYILFITHEPNPEAHDIFKRFAKVFEQTYTRFLDLQKAEAQAREAKIEAALEKVRSRSLAMHKSDELQEVVNSVFDRFKELEIETDTASIYIIKEGTKDLDCWLQTAEQTYSSGILFPYFDQSIMSRETLIRGEGYVSKTYTKNEKNEWFNLMFLHSDMRKIPETRKQFILDAEAFTASRAHMKNTSINIFRYSAKEFRVSEYDVLKRFAKVFEQAYIRFLDLKKAEAQARESQIQLALERVRARTMAMQKSDELKDVAHELRVQLADLGTNELETCAINLYEEHDEFLEAWVAVRPPDSPKDISEFHFLLPKKGIYIIEDILEAYGSGVEEFVFELGGTKGVQWMNTMETLVPEMFAVAAAAPDFKNTGTVQAWFCCQYFSGGALIMITMTPPLEESRSLMKRCTQVFSLAYRRFADLKKAEAQAKEAQIEAALERVRSRSMGMQKSEELKEVIQVVYEQFVHVNIPIEHTGFIMDYKGRNDMQIWLADKHEVPSQVTIPYFDSPHWNSFNEAKEKGKDFFANKLTFEEKNRFYQKLFEFIPGLPEESKEYYLSCSGLAISTVLLDNVGLYIENFSGIPYSNEENATLMRFGKVFQQTYTRFLDLQKAEAQARESQIEAALERVRSRTMAMQRSEELVDVASILFQQVKALGVPQWNCGFNIWELGDKDFTYYPGSPDGKISPSPCKISLTEHPVFISFDESRKRGDELFVYEKEGEYQAEHYRYMLSLPGVGDLLRSMLEAGFQLPTFQIDHVANFAYGNLIFITYEHFPEMHDVFKRFAKVFEQTYTRFLDLQKAEAQTKEAQIEAALEKVRSRSLAMHKSEEVGFVVDELFLRMKDLEIGFDSVNILEFTDDAFQVWAAYKPGKFTVTKIPFSKSDIPYVGSAIEAKNSGLKLFVHQYSFEEKNLFLKYLFDETHFKNLPDERKQFLLACPCYTVSIGFAKNTAIQLQSYSRAAFSERENNILNRFVNVFEQAYTRFLDLQQAEGQAREAQIQLALERVRARTMAMQHSNELSDAASVIFQQVKELGIEAWTCGFSIWDEDRKASTAWLSRGVMQPPFKTPLTENQTLMHFYEAAQRGESLFVEEVSGDTLTELYRYLGTLLVAEGVSDKIRKPGYSPPTFQVNHVAYFSYGYLLFITYQQYPEAHDIFKRFAKVFDQTYTRFLDLQKAEALARESQIEASLERVRSKTMAMHNSQDVGDTVATVFDELLKLNIKTNRCGILIFSNSTDTEAWTAKSTTSGKVNLIIGHFDVTRHPMLTNARNSWKNREASFTYELIGDDLINYYRMINNQPDYPIQFNMESLPSKEIHTEFYFPDGAVFAFTSEPIAADDSQIFKRLASVFGQTYRRYLDLQKAEAQAREAQIEAALERVRSRTMAMHRSEEIADIVGKIFKELTSLDVALNRVLIWIFNSDEKYFTWWSANPEAESNAESYRVNYVDHPVFSTYFDAWEKKLPLLLYTLGDDLKVSWEDHLFKNTELSRIPKAVQDGMRSEKKIFTTSAIGEYGLLMAGCFEPFSEEVNDIIQRFGRVFQQSYTRYVDVQKAEAQAREAQIEAALERTRTQSMLMQHSVQLDDTLRVFHEQVLLLGIKSAFSFLWLPDEKNDRHIFWAAWAETSSSEQVKKDSTVFKSKAINYPLDRNEPATAQCLVDWKSDQPVHSYHVRPADVENYFAAWKELLDGVEKLKPEYFQGGLYYVEAFMKYGCFGVMLEGEMPEDEKKTLSRLAIEFERAYTRFLDLQKAEAQAREATIEASLEKVRGKAISMHNSSDLTATASLVFTELRKLGIDSLRSGVGLLTKENRNIKLYSATSSEEGGSFSLVGWAVLDHHPVLSKAYDSWVNSEDYYPVLRGETLKSYYENIIATFTVPAEQSEGYEQHGYFLPFSEGLFYGWSEKPYTETEIKILHRFRGIVDLTFRRYMELEKSEATAKEAIRQASLDRVRAEIASMRTTNDLDRITPLIWKELNILSIPFVRCGVFIMDDFQLLMHSFLSTPEGEAIAAFHLPYETPGNTGEILSHWRNKQMYISHWDESAFSDLGEQLVKQGAIPSKDVYMNTIPSGGIHLHCLPFLQGMLYVGNTTQLKEDDIHLIQSVADAFSTAYARYEDFNKLESAKIQIEKTLTDLKQTQNLLVQSEKMASLGELTAGIAHEIQNPLNFVNNFSEVSNELLEEMKEEIEKGNYDEVQAITSNIKQNLEKILHHGKRADGIVKGMLQHSRSSSGVKEPTDINALADEYLRLAYHGFRAKDKSFNASTNTDLDKTVGKVNVVPQDIGRVVLNLITNAFYAVTEKQKKTAAEYQPTVFLSTKRCDDCVMISVKDNGNGIPEQIREKIFQPFFTTKPTGQGTGLGLSLSYDIVKAHGGELKMETKEGEGSEFVISIML